MGVRNNTETRKEFYSMMSGKVVRSYGKKRPEGVNNLTERINKNGDTVYEVNFDEIYGTITKIEIKEHEEYGKFLILHLNDGGETSVVQMGMISSYAQSFMMKSPNIDPTRALLLRPYSFEDKETGKRRTGITIMYADDNEENKIPNFWTKDNPGKLPQLELIKVKGKDTWDNTKQLEYLEKYLNEKFIPKIPSLDSISNSTSFDNEPLEGVQVVDNEDDDLPF